MKKCIQCMQENEYYNYEEDMGLQGAVGAAGVDDDLRFSCAKCNISEDFFFLNQNSRCEKCKIENCSDCRKSKGEKCSKCKNPDKTSTVLAYFLKGFTDCQIGCPEGEFAPFLHEWAGEHLNVCIGKCHVQFCKKIK